MPDDPTWFALIVGLVYYLTFEENWQQFEGAISQADAADRWLELWWDMELATTDVPAPYWDDDDADDADDESDESDQPWYGGLLETPDGLTWVEQVGYWAITAFVAIAATPAAAVTFTVLAKRFILAWQTHDLGGIVRVFIDGSQVGEVDTYSPSNGVANMTITIPETTGFRAMDVDTHVLWVELTDEANPAVVGTPTMRLIRKQLTAGEVAPTNTRYDFDCDCVQVTPDGGASWNNAPQLDPRHNTAYQLPPRGGSDPRCDAAANMREKLENMVNQFEQELSQIQVANALIAIIDVFLPEVGIIIALIQAVAEAILAIGSAAISAAFTDDQWDLLLCLIYCNLTDDGTLTADGLQALMSAIHAQADTVVYDVMFFLIPMLGEVGMTNAGATGEATADCSDCDCPPSCHEWVNPGSTSVDAFFTYRDFASGLTPNVNFTRITIDWQLNPNSGATLVAASISVSLSGTVQLNQNITTNTGEVVLDNLSGAATSFGIEVKSYFNGGSNYPDLPLVRFEYLPNAAISWVGGSDC